MDARLRKEDWRVTPVTLARARALVEEHHYARGASKTAVAVDGVYAVDTDLLCGVSWWLPPTRVAAAAAYADPSAVVGLSRLVLVPGMPKNAATFLLMRSLRRLEPRWECCLTYADTWQGYTGHIYLAAGWEYLGLTKPKRVYVRGGRMVSCKLGPRTKTHLEMLALGAEMVGSFSKHRFRYVRGVAPAKPTNEVMT